MESCNTKSSLDLPLESLSLQPFLQSLHKEQWQEVRLGEIVDVKHGYAFAGKNITTEHTPNVLVTPGNFHIGGGFKSQKFKYFNGEIPKSFVFSTGDIIVTMTDLSKDGDTLGYSAKIPKDSEHIYLHNQRIGLLLFLRSDICKDFIYWLLRTKNYQAFIVNSATGTSVKHTSPKLIGEYRFPLPPLTTQQKIAEILSSFDDKIDLLHRQNKTLESLALTLFRHYFIDNPKRDEWEEKPLKYFGNIICGKTPPKNQKEYFNGTYPFIKIPDMHNNVFVFQTADSLTQQGLDSQKAKTLPPFSVCVSCIATIGVVSMNANIAQTNQQINSIVPYKECYRYFLYCSMKSSFDELEAMASGGTATANLNTTDFSNMKLLLPREKEILRFHTETLPFFDKIYNNTKQIQNLQAMRDLMLRKIFN